MGQIKLPEGAAPGTPASGYGALFVDTSGRWWVKDDAGNVLLLSGSIGARAYNSANISIPDTTVTALTFDSERWDTDSIHSTSSNTGRLTCTIAGKYLIIANIRFATNSTGTRAVNLRLNGSNIAGVTQAGATGSNICLMHVSTIYDLAVGDYVEVTVQQTSGGNLNVEASSPISPEFMMWKLN
jgi:hypothetical protein